MKVYRAKTLIDGYKLGDEFKGKLYVGVPQKKAESGYYVTHHNSIMAIQGKDPDARLKFSDKYGRGDYWLFYYEWVGKKPTIATKIT